MQYDYVTQTPFEAVVIGSMTLSELLCFQNETVLEALAVGKPVILYTPGLPQAPANRALGAALAAKRRELKSWGVVFTDGGQRRVITAAQARELLEQGQHPGPGAVLTPSAREILEGRI